MKNINVHIHFLKITGFRDMRLLCQRVIIVSVSVLIHPWTESKEFTCGHSRADHADSEHHENVTPNRTVLDKREGECID